MSESFRKESKIDCPVDFCLMHVVEQFYTHHGFDKLLDVLPNGTREWLKALPEFRTILDEALHSRSQTNELRNLVHTYTTLAENAEWMAANIDKTIPAKLRIKTLPRREKQT